jgi:hypothetical protein
MKIYGQLLIVNFFYYWWKLTTSSGVFFYMEVQNGINALVSLFKMEKKNISTKEGMG